MTACHQSCPNKHKQLPKLTYGLKIFAFLNLVPKRNINQQQQEQVQPAQQQFQRKQQMMHVECFQVDVCNSADKVSANYLQIIW